MRHKIRWTAQKLRKRLELIKPLVFTDRRALLPFSYHILEEPIPEPVSTKQNDVGDGRLVKPGDYWAGPDTTFSLRTTFSTAGFHRECDQIVLLLPIGISGDFSHPEALVYIDDVPVAACDRHHQEILLPFQFRDGGEHQLLLRGWTGGTRQPEENRLQMNRCYIARIDPLLKEFTATARAALGISEQLTDDNPIKHNLVSACDEAFLSLDTREPIADRFFESVPAALEILRKKLISAGPPHLARISAVGHAHIDLAWLWTIEETKRKANRTFTNVLSLMAEEPSFTFTQSQPQLYSWIKEDHPELFSSVQRAIHRGQWEPVGGMWVEADCNLTGAESLARQFLLGRTFFKREFGAGSDSPVLWLPDVFGYAANLPQLMKQAGLRYFFTIKLGWNQYNRIPYDMFWWEGIDGTKVLTHFSTTKQPESAMVSTYNSDASPGQIMSTWTNFQQKDIGQSGSPPPLLMSYGYGDGGGGPTREMLENINILSDFPGAPRLKFSKAIDFYQELEQDVGEFLPTWQGELYLEYHRGTYTTQSRIKRANRKTEVLLHDAEFLCTAAAWSLDNFQYPKEELRRAWECHCLNQFHDILPGSSIGPVYEKALNQYEALTKDLIAVRSDALDALSENLGSPGASIVVNPSPFEQKLPVLIPVTDHSDSVLPYLVALEHQPVEDGILVDAGVLPPYSITCLSDLDVRSSEEAFADYFSVSVNHLENEYLKISFNEDGDIVSIFDKTQVRELVPHGELANEFQLFEDRPLAPDAWDIDKFYDDRMWTAEPASSINVVESGPLRAAVEIRRKALSSDLKQKISLYRSSPLISFETEVNWHEKRTLLKVAFPLEVNSAKAAYEIQWGHVERPTHENTSWDWARFESCAQKWVDLSEGGYGVSLINDCKHGHDIHGNVIRLSLLRGTTDPDPDADQGIHRFSYGLLPHPRPLSEITTAAAYGFNDPPIVYLAQRAAPPAAYSSTYRSGSSFISSSQANVIIETIKTAEDGEGIIIRLYESMRKRSAVDITCAFELKSAWKIDLLENNSEQIECGTKGFAIEMKPFEIATFRLVPA